MSPSPTLGDCSDPNEISTNLSPTRPSERIVAKESFLITLRVPPARSIDAHFLVRPYWKLDLPDSTFMNSPDANFGSPVQASNILELGFKAIRRVEKELLLPDPEHSSGKDQQRYDDEDS